MKRFKRLFALVLAATLTVGSFGMVGTEAYAAEAEGELLSDSPDLSLIDDELLAENAEAMVPDKGADYKLWVGGVQVTDDNKNDLSAGFTKVDSASYDPSTNTLTIIKNAGFKGSYKGALIYAEQPLTIKGQGINMGANETNEATNGINVMGTGNDLTLDGHLLILGDFEGYGIYCQGKSTIGENASLTILGPSFFGVGDITINGGKLNIEENSGFGEGLTCSDGNIYVNGGDVDIEVGEKGMIAAADTEGNGNIFIRNPLKVKSEKSDALFARGTIWIDRGNYYVNTTGAKVTAKSTYTTITDADGNDLKSVDIRKESDSDKYDLWVGGMQVTKHWLHDLGGITKGSAAYDPATKTLTLNDVEGFEYFYENSWIYTTDDLIIDGKADIKTRISELDNAIRGKKSLGFKGTFDMSHLSSPVAYGIRTLGSIDTYEGCRVYIYASNGIQAQEIINFRGGTVISEAAGGNGIYAKNSILIDGAEVSAYADTDTHYGICSKGKINIQSGVLKAQGTGAGGCAIQADGGLTINTEALKIVKPESGATVKDGTVVDSDGNPAAEVEIEPPIVIDYGITIGGKVQITDANAADVLGDGKISYDDSTKTLTLNNVTDFGELHPAFPVIHSSHGLTIAGKATIPSGAYFGISVESTEPLLIKAEIDAPGTDYGIQADGDITLLEAKLALSSSIYALLADGNINIYDSSVILSGSGSNDTLKAGGKLDISGSTLKSVNSGTGKAINAGGGIILDSSEAIYEPENGMLSSDKKTVLNEDYTEAKSVLIDKIVTYTVKFDNRGHGTAPADETVLKGNTLSNPGALTETGWKFIGWYREAACKNLYDFSTPVTSDITLYAKWVDEAIKTYTVKFILNKPGTAPADQIIIEGEKAVKPATDPVTPGYIFDRWLLPTDIEYDFDAPVTEDLILYAQWNQEGTFTVEFIGVSTDPYYGLAKSGDRYQTVYTGESITPEVLVYGPYPGVMLTEGEDYTVKYGNNKKVTSGKPATVTVSGKGIYKGKKTLEFDIIPTDINTALSKGMLEISGLSATSGSKATATIITYYGYVFKSGDYSLTNTSRITTDGQTTDIKGKGNFTGKITGQTIKLLDKDTAKKLTLKAKVNAKKVFSGGDPVYLTSGELTVTNGSNEILTKDTDYYVKYINNHESGTARAIIAGAGAYASAKSVMVSYKIAPLKNAQFKVTPLSTWVSYSPTGATVPLKVEHYNEKADSWYTLTNGYDYTVKYSSNKKAGQGKYTVSFIGNYKGNAVISGAYDIAPADIATADIIIPPLSYTKKGKYLSKPYVSIDNALVSSKDYEVKYFDTSDKAITGPIELAADEQVRTIKVVLTGKGSLTGTTTAFYRIMRPESKIDLSKAKISVTKSAEYNSEPLMPMVTVRINGSVVPSSAYNVAYLNNKYKGSAIVIVEGNGYASVGSTTGKFNVTPKDLLSFLSR